MKIAFVPYRPAFLDSFFDWRHQPSWVAYNPILKVDRDQLGANMLETGTDLSDLSAYETFRWFVTVNGKPAGNVSLKEINLMMGLGEIGYGISEEYQGRGLATAAVRYLCDRVFRETDLRKIIAYVHDENLASCRVLEKCGFTREGFLREHYVINDRPANEVLYGLLKREWHGDS